nr:MAG TPA: hypothetical protein [Caudoviricetes sp.]
MSATDSRRCVRGRRFRRPIRSIFSRHFPANSAHWCRRAKTREVHG